MFALHLVKHQSASTIIFFLQAGYLDLFPIPRSVKQNVSSVSEIEHLYNNPVEFCRASEQHLFFFYLRPIPILMLLTLLITCCLQRNPSYFEQNPEKRMVSYRPRYIGQHVTIFSGFDCVIGPVLIIADRETVSAMLLWCLSHNILLCSKIVMGCCYMEIIGILFFSGLQLLLQ